MNDLYLLKDHIDDGIDSETALAQNILYLEKIATYKTNSRLIRDQLYLMLLKVKIVKTL